MACDEPAPRRAFLVFDSARLPNAGPVKLRAFDFDFRQRRFERVDRAFVGINTNPQLPPADIAGAHRFKARLETDGEKQDRKLVVEPLDAAARIGKNAEIFDRFVERRTESAHFGLTTPQVAFGVCALAFYALPLTAMLVVFRIKKAVERRLFGGETFELLF